MKTAIIVHGMPSEEGYYGDGDSESNSHWIPWLQQQLIKNHILPHTPEMPRPFAPDYDTWKREFERYDLNEDTLLVGHSCGAGFIMRYLSENPKVTVGKVVLVAPWIDPNKELTTGMFNFELREDINEQTAGIIIFESDNDDDEMKQTVLELKTKLGIDSVVFHNYGHFTLNDMKTREFPELIYELIN